MKRNMVQKRLAILLACAMALPLAACAPSGSSSSEQLSSSPPTETSSSSMSGSGDAGPQLQIGEVGTTTPNDVPTITLYPRDANLMSGVVGGYKGDYFASRGFNVEVWAYSDEKTNAILASGAMPDIMYIPTKNVDDMIESGMLLNLDSYLEQMPHVQSYEGLDTALNYVREYRSNGTGSVYVMPLVTTRPAIR